MKKRSLNKIKQMVSIGMSCIMAGSTCNLPMMLHAEEVQTENMHPTYMVTSFDELNEEIAYQALSIGAEESEINFPDTLKVKVIRQVEGEPSTEADEEESSTEAVEEESSTEAEEETTSKVLESQTEAESKTEEESEVESGTETEVKPQTEVESQTEIESESQTEVELQTEVENETLESESETEVPMTETEVPETTAALEPQTQVPETTVSESETESTEQLESDTTEEESSIVASLIDSIKGLFTPVEVYAAEEHIAYSAGEGNGAEDSQEGEEWTIEHITWKLDAEKSSLPEFDSSEESAGAVYIYTPTIPETDENGNHYILSEEAILPEIYVMVDCVDNGIVLYSSNIVASGTCGAEGNNGDNLTWILDDEGVLTISGTGAMASWKFKGSPWYANKDKIESVVIEDGVTSIGKDAFDDCSSLASIKLPNSISSIGNAAFNNCSSLASITLPNSISSIGELAFYYCSSLTSITIPNSVTNIGVYTFSECSNLASITISNSITSIAEGTFDGCSSLTSITIPNNVTSIGLSAFEKCIRLTSITIPNSVISIGKFAFYDCSSLTSITIPNSVTSIEYDSFKKCNSLTNAIYLGTAEQWNDKNIGSGNDALLNNVKFHEHWPETVWSNNDTYHWHQCTYGAGACPVKDEPQAQDSYALHDWENGKCRVCGYICTHTEAEEWIQTAQTHEKKWSCCNLVTVKEAAHDWENGKCRVCGYICTHTGGTATCIAKAVCTICKQPYGEVDSNNHAGEEKWTQTEEKHEKKCNKCGVVTVAEKEHDWENGTCSECGYICTHTGGTATCTAKAVCTICKQPYGEVDSNNHAGEEKWTQTEEKHEKKCNKCGVVTVAEKEHDWKNGTCSECGYICTHTGGTATCTAKAVCTICKQPYGEVDSNNHAGEEKWTQTEEKHEKKCNKCGVVTVAEKEHDWENGTCSECGYICTHTGGTATCTAKAVCTICKQPYGEVDSNNHAGEEKWTQTKEKHEKKCNKCGVVTVAEKGHDWKNGTCSECGYICTHTGGTATCTAKAVCTICNQPYGEVDSSKHTGTEEWTQTEKTHEKKWNCCNLVIVKKEVHEWKDGTCEECGYACQHKDGNNDHLCDICNKKISEHTGGTATCIAKAVCTICNQPYGEVDSSKHTGTEEWIQTEKTHEKKWNCCNLVTVKEEVHEWKDGTCEECGYACQHKDDNHDHFCDICNKKVSEHTGGTATCIAKAVCTTCGHEYGEVDSSNHTGKEEWTQTEKTHEKKWNCCNLVIVKKEVHEWKDGVCSECEYVCQHKDVDKNHLCDACGEAMGIHEAAQGKHTCDYCNKVVSEHTGGTATCKDLAICDVCGEPYGKLDQNNHAGGRQIRNAEEATCTKEGYTGDIYCNGCGDKLSSGSVTKSLGHKDTNKDHFCDVCNTKISEHIGGIATCIAKAVCTECGMEYGEIDSKNHDLKHHEAKAATCTEIGWEAYDTCKREGCNYSTYVELPALNHDLEYHEAKAATCTEIGWEAYDTCKREGCNYTTYKELSALKHDLQHHAAKAATCTEIGWEEYDTCKREGCNYTTYKELSALKHDLKHHEAKAATCTEIGWDAYETCKREGCNYSTYVELPALNHDLEHHEAKAATCTDIGWEKYDTCKREGCTYSTYKEIAALNHDLEHHEAKAATCTDIGWEKYDTCKRDGCTYSTYKEIAALEHDLEHHEAKAATCTEIGWNAYDTCKRDGCGYTTYKELPALNHDLEHHEAQAATCTEIGWEAYDTCKREGCNYSTYVELPALKHDLEHHEAKAATCTEIGWEAYDTCKREGCGYTTYVELPALKHDLEHHEAKAATCTEIGWEAYDTCKREGCGYTTYVELPKLNHDLDHHEAQAATCTEIGWEAYDTCKREGCNYTTYKELPALGHEDSNNDHLCDACSTKISDHSYESKIAREATTTYTGIRIYTCTKCGHSYTEELAKLPSQTNQADQTNQIEPANNGNEKDFIGTVTSVFLNVTNFAAKNFIISFGSMIQMPSQTDQANQSNQPDQTNQIEPANNGNEKDFIGTVTSAFLNETDLTAKNFIISFRLMIQMLLKAVMQLW